MKLFTIDSIPTVFYIWSCMYSIFRVLIEQESYRLVDQLMSPITDSLAGDLTLSLSIAICISFTISVWLWLASCLGNLRLPFIIRAKGKVRAREMNSGQNFQRSQLQFNSINSFPGSYQPCQAPFSSFPCASLVWFPLQTRKLRP